MLPRRLQLGSPVKVLSRGTTRPLVCLLEGEDGKSQDWVVKLPERRRPLALAAEAVGALLVELAGVRTPDAGYLVLPEEPLGLGQNDEWCRLDEALETFGGHTAFCSRYIGSAHDHTPGMESRQQPEMMLALFVLDAFMWHFDRTDKTPNLLWDAEGLIAIDHGRALFQLEAVEESGASLHDPRAIRDENWPSHLAFKYLRRQFGQGRLAPGSVLPVLEQIQRGCLAGRFEQELVRWLDVLAATHFQRDIAYFVTTRAAHINSLNDRIVHVLASR